MAWITNFPVALYSKLLVYLQLYRVSYATHCIPYVMHTWFRSLCPSGGLSDARCHTLACCASVGYKGLKCEF